MKILFINENIMHRFGNNYYTRYSWVNFPLRLSQYCEQVTLLTPLRNHGGTDAINDDQGLWKIEDGKLLIEELDPYDSFAEFYRFLPTRLVTWIKKLWRLLKTNDVVVLRMPSPILTVLFFINLFMRKPMVCLLVGNTKKASDHILKSRGLKRVVYQTLINVMIWFEDCFSRTASLVYVHSGELAQRLQGCSAPVRSFNTPHLSLEEFAYREDTCRVRPVKIIQVGWLVACKGIEYTLEAISALTAKGIDVELHIMGCERETGYQKELERLSCRLGIEKKVKFMGWTKYDQMKSIYRNADIQVISSLSEGFPRCVVEGAAYGVPLVSTNVGGCGDRLTHETNALLVAPCDSSASADAIARLINDTDLRRKIIANGYKTAKTFSFETVGMQFLKEIEELHSLIQKKDRLSEGVR